jgi:hypothetical protein
LFRNQTISLGWREEWRQIVQEAKAHLELWRRGEERDLSSQDLPSKETKQFSEQFCKFITNAASVQIRGVGYDR